MAKTIKIYYFDYVINKLKLGNVYIIRYNKFINIKNYWERKIFDNENEFDIEILKYKNLETLKSFKKNMLS